MVSFEEIQAAYYMVAATGVLVAAVYYVFNMRAAIKTREAQLFMQIFEIFRNEDFWAAINETRKSEFDEYLEKTQIKMTFKDYNRLNAVSAYFEGIGLMLKRGYLNVDLINDFMPLTILSYFENIKPYIQWRIERSCSTYRWKNFQYLYKLVKETNERRLKSYDRYLMVQKKREGIFSDNI